MTVHTLDLDSSFASFDIQIKKRSSNISLLSMEELGEPRPQRVSRRERNQRWKAGSATSGSTRKSPSQSLSLNPTAPRRQKTNPFVLEGAGPIRPQCNDTPGRNASLSPTPPRRQRSQTNLFLKQAGLVAPTLPKRKRSNPDLFDDPTSELLEEAPKQNQSFGQQRGRANLSLVAQQLRLPLRRQLSSEAA